MALGDADITGGVFFADFGERIAYNGASTYFGTAKPVQGIVQELGKDTLFGNTSVSDAQYKVLLPYNAFAPMPAPGQPIQVLTGRLQGMYTVRSSDPVEDGSLVELMLRKP